MAFGGESIILLIKIDFVKFILLQSILLKVTQYISQFAQNSKGNN